MALIPHLCIPAQEPRRQRTLLEGGEFWALSYTWSLPLSPSPFLTHFETQANDTLKQAKACIYKSPTVYTRWRLIPEKTQHPPKQRVVTVQQMMHTDTNQSTNSPPPKTPRPFLYCFGLRFSSHLLTRKQKHSSYTLSPTLADAVPTDPIDDSHLRIKL